MARNRSGGSGGEGAGERTLADMVYVGFNRRVVALDRYSGALLWTWRAPVGGNPVLLLDGDRLIVSVNGYTFCLDPVYGQLVWRNDLPGLGMGIPSLASLRGGAVSSPLGHQAARQAQAAAAAG